MEERNIKDATLDIVKTINKDFVQESLLPRWPNYSAVSKFKSVRRAIRRGHMDLVFGIVYPNRPFNNRKPTTGRSHNQLKKKVYGRIKGLQ